MFRTQLSTVAAGSVLGKTLYNERGDVLLRKGAVLTDRYLTLLRDKGFQSVHVQDADTADIEIEDIVSEHVRTNATKNIYRFLQVVENASKEYQKLPPERLGAALGTSGDLRSEARGNAYEALYSVVESIIDDVLGAATLTGLTAIKTHDNYTFCHSVDVTVTAIMLGKKLFFDRTALRQLALGCMLHDAGKMFIDPTILNKPGRLNPEEFELMKKHPTLGYQMLRNIQKDEFLANHVAYQHHERQDGGGYPRGLRGTNRIHRNAAGRGHMLLIAEIAAVADVYDALSSDRPYRPGMSPEQIVETIRGMAGPHLNRDIVGHFLSILPVFPVGLEVKVTQGRLAGSRGVVAKVNERALDRPLVRILVDAQGRRVPAFDLDLAKEPSAAVAATFGLGGGLARAS